MAGVSRKHNGTLVPKGRLWPLKGPFRPYHALLVSLGDTIALDILVDPDDRRKVVDYIQLYKLPF